MKKIITALLACLLVLSMSVTAFADGYAQNEADYNVMVEYAAKQTPAITLTDQYFSVDDMPDGSNFKFELSTDSEKNIEVLFCVFVPQNLSQFGAVYPVATKSPKVSFSKSLSYEYSPTSISLQHPSNIYLEAEKC